jgi:aryl-alcohol dehydrogenase-like predicted oxidoreductase
MEERTIERLGRSVSVVGLGTWQLGGDWGSVSPGHARATLQAAVDQGITFFDTADVYGDGRSEQFCGELHRRDPEVLIATKMGRRAEQLPENYSRKNFLDWNDRSRSNLGVEQLDLVQLHSPPDAVFGSDAVFAALDEMVSMGRIRAYGVSVETSAQALAAIARPRVATVQIILNCFRLKPLEEVLPAAQEAGVGIIARVPLASGLLSGRYDEHTVFAPDDHRSFNRHGEAFDVSTVIPGARNPEQVRGNAASASLAPLREDQLAGVRDVYDRLLRPLVHDRW